MGTKGGIKLAGRSALVWQDNLQGVVPFNVNNPFTLMLWWMDGGTLPAESTGPLGLTFSPPATANARSALLDTQQRQPA